MTGPRPAVAVTGASGFVGRHLCARLAADGHPVHALVRRPAGPWPPGVSEHVVPGLDDAAALRAACDGCGVVVHAAGRAHVLRERAADPAAEFHRVNVDGTRTALEAAAAAGADTFVLLSSVAAVGSGDAGALSADPAPRPATAYGASKLAAERVVLDAAGAFGLRPVVLRPPMVYGPGMRGNPLRLFAMLDRGLPLPLGRVRNRRSMLYVGHLAAAVAAALRAELARRPYFVADDGAPSTVEYVRAAARALGRPARLVPVPVALLRAAAAAGDRLAPVLPVPLTTAALEGLAGTLIVDDAPFRAAAAWRPAVTFADALAETAAWFRGTRGPGTALAG